MKCTPSTLLFARILALFLLQFVSLGQANASDPCCDDCVCEYSTHTSPTLNGEIEVSGSTQNIVVTEGTSLTFSVSASDTDKLTVDCVAPESGPDPPLETYYVGDGASANWTASDGSPSSANFTGGFGWTAPMLGSGECSRTVTITATATDGDSTCPGGSCYGGNCNDGDGGSDSIQVTVKKASDCDAASVDGASGSGFVEDPTEVSVEATSELSATATDPTCCEDEDGPTWSWTVTATEYRSTCIGTWASDANGPTIDHPDSSSPAATLKATPDKAGYWRFKVKATATWECWDDNCVKDDESDWIELTAAGDCAGASVTSAAGSAFDKDPVCLNIESKSTLSASKTDPTTCETCPGTTNPTWSWVVTESEYRAAGAGWAADGYKPTIDHPNPTSPTATLKAKVAKGGYWKFKVEAKAIWHCESGPCIEKKESNWITLTAINWKLELEPDDNFTGRSLTKVGVGETGKVKVVPLDGTDPVTLTPITWTCTPTTCMAISGATGLTTNFTAKDRACTATVKSTIAGCEKTLAIEVIEPSGVTMTQEAGTGVWHDKDTASVGFKGRAYITPADVSFTNIEVREQAVLSVATGYWHPNLHGINHALGAWLGIGPVVPGLGTKDGAVDTISTGGPWTAKPYSAGTFTWAIPWEFRVGTGNAKQFSIVTHEQTIDGDGANPVNGNDGRTTISKGGHSETKNYADASSTY